jgi:hypothetical protein
MTGSENSPGAADEVVFVRELVELTRIEAEALIRFAAEFVYHATYAPATAAGLAAAYRQTVPDGREFEEVHVFLQELAEHVHVGLGEDFTGWARRTVMAHQATCEITDLVPESDRGSAAEDLPPGFQQTRGAGTQTPANDRTRRRRGTAVVVP